MAEKQDVHFFDSSDDDISLAAAEEVGLLSKSTSKPHRRTSSLHIFVSHTRQTLGDSLQDLDFIHNALAIALLAALWHSFSLAISVVSSLFNE